MRNWVFRLKVELLRARRLLCWLFVAWRFARPVRERPAGVDLRVWRHTSPLVRDPARAALELQRGKLQNLRLTAPRIDGTLIRPGQVFSLAYLAGKATRRAGFEPGLELKDGRMQPGIGGGRCQISNLLYWLALHLDLEIVERHRHDYDLFPDYRRSQPFGSGATFYWNYLDLRVRNPHPFSIWLRLYLTATDLVAEAYTAAPLPFTVQVYETDHRFYRQDGGIWRANRLWRRVTACDPAVQAAPGAARELVLKDELIAQNRGRVLYPVPEDWLEVQPEPARYFAL
ncbi:MAG: VanW family protein [Symbiobacteriia bacterium]